MAKRVTWKENALVSLRLSDELFTIAQMLRSPYLRLFAVHNSNGEWHDLDMNRVESLFCVVVGRVVLQQLSAGKVARTVIPTAAPFGKLWIEAYANFDGGFPFLGGKLIEVDPAVGTTKAPVVKDWLSPKHDAEIIRRCELTNMWGADDLRRRLIHYFETGKDRNEFKEKVFDFSLRGHAPTDGDASGSRTLFGPPPGAFERE